MTTERGKWLPIFCPSSRLTSCTCRPHPSPQCSKLLIVFSAPEYILRDTMNVPNLSELARFYVSALCLGASIKRQGQSFLQGPQVDFHVFNAIICCFFLVSGKFPTGRCCSDAWLVQHNLPPSQACCENTYKCTAAVLNCSTTNTSAKLQNTAENETEHIRTDSHEVHCNQPGFTFQTPYILQNILYKETVMMNSSNCQPKQSLKHRTPFSWLILIKPPIEHLECDLN
jgi:hypothetical protein